MWTATTLAGWRRDIGADELNRAGCSGDYFSGLPLVWCGFDSHISGFTNDDVERVPGVQLGVWVLIKPDDKGVYQECATRWGRILPQ